MSATFENASSKLCNKMIKGIILEGIVGSGKTMLYRHLLRQVSNFNCSLLSLNEYCTERSLEPLKNASISDSLQTLKSILTILKHFQNISCQYKNKLIKLFILERFHLSHCLDISDKDTLTDYEWIEKQMRMLNPTIVILTFDPSRIMERSVITTRQTRPKSWSRYLSSLGTTDDSIAAYYRIQQERLISLCSQSTVPIMRIDTSYENWSELAEEITTTLLPC